MKKILLIEDQKDISKNIKDFLEIYDFKVNTFYSWETWLKSALEYDYDLILLDIWLPKLNWFIVCEEILKQKNIPILFITAREFIEDKLFWLKLWAQDYIIKPFDLRELKARIEIHLKNNKTQKNIFIYNNISLDFENLIFKFQNNIIHLNQKEIEILKLICNNWTNITTRNEIIENIWWESALFDSDSKLDVYISTLRQKLSKDFIKTQKWFWYHL